MTVLLEHRNKRGEERHETPGADEIGGGPSLLQGGLHGDTIGWLPWPTDVGRGGQWWPGQ